MHERFSESEQECCRKSTHIVACVANPLLVLSFFEQSLKRRQLGEYVLAVSAGEGGIRRDICPCLVEFSAHVDTDLQ